LEISVDEQKPEQATLGVVEPDKGKYQRAEKAPAPPEEDPKKLKMGKGLVPEKKEESEAVKLKPFEKQVSQASD